MTEPAAPATLCQLFHATVARYKGQVALRPLGETATITRQQYTSRGRQIAAGLAGLGTRWR